MLMHQFSNFISLKIKAFFHSCSSNVSSPLHDGHNAVFVPGTTSPSSGIFGPVGENVRRSTKIPTLNSSLNGSDDYSICALSMAHVNIYFSAFKVLRILALILSKEPQRTKFL